MLYLRKAYKGGTTDTLGPSQVPPPALPFCYASPSRAYSPPSHQASLTIAIIHLYSCAERETLWNCYTEDHNTISRPKPLYQKSSAFTVRPTCHLPTTYKLKFNSNRFFKLIFFNIVCGSFWCISGLTARTLSTLSPFGMMQPLSILTCGAGDVVISSRRCSKRSHLLHTVTTISATRETVLLKQPVFRWISFQENSEFSGTAFQNIWRVGF